MTPDTQSEQKPYQCLFCGDGIKPGPLDPCALNLITGIDHAHADQKEQTFYCHLSCLQSHASIHPGNFYITEPDFPSTQELESEA